MKSILFTLRALFNFHKNATDIENIRFTLQRVGGGVYKRVDENREMLALIQNHSPQLLNDHPHLIDWISSHDEFLTEASKFVTPKSCFFQPRKGFPRPFPLYAVK